jgi:hypothetical protein
MTIRCLDPTLPGCKSRLTAIIHGGNHAPGSPAQRRHAVGFGSPRPWSCLHGYLHKEFALQPLSPRQIQARVRAGASPEVVAAETGWPLDKVTRYAQPPLGERAYVAEQARAVEISRSRGGSTLEESVLTRLSADPDDITWDAHRTDDARWVVTATHRGSAVGVWTYETVGRTVHPQDESARALMGGGPSAVAETSTSPAHDSQGPLSDQVPVAEPSVENDEAVDAPRPRLVSVTSNPVTRTPPTPEPTDERVEQEALIEQSEVSTSPRRAKRAKGKKGRASVPSWDEILFGASRPED